MGSETEPAKLLLPYLQRADELQKHEPLVAYYCRLYAMERGLKIPQKDRTKTTNALLLSLMKQLEKDKKSIKLGPDDNLYVEGFASNLFAKADKQDRAGRADLNTAKTFYAASIFFEILYQFGELQPEIEQKQKYAVWKAADIRKALKEDRKPEPGPPGGDLDLSLSSDPSIKTYDEQPGDGFPSDYQHVGDASSQHVDKNLGTSESFAANYQNADTPAHHVDEVNSQNYGQPPMASSSYSSPDYPSDIHHPQSTIRPEYSAYSSQYDHHSYGNEHQPLPPNNHSPENLNPTFSYPNFQSYPSFHDSTLPSAPTHQPSYYHPHDSTYAHQPAPPSQYAPSVQYSSGSVNNQSHVVQATPPAEKYKYDSNYQPSPEKIAEAHKAARFAVGALAFEDVQVAIDHLRRSLELLVNPSAETH